MKALLYIKFHGTLLTLYEVYTVGVISLSFCLLLPPPPSFFSSSPPLSVPLVSRICPSDTYRVWKSGQCLRVDTTLMGFEQMTWQRGNRSFIFRGQGVAHIL